MALNPRIWYPIAAVGFVVNVVGAAFAVNPADPWHAGIHATLAVAFGVWAQHLKVRKRAAAMESGDEPEIAVLRDDIGELRRELSELQERMDFAERLLSQAREIDRLPDRRPGE